MPVSFQFVYLPYSNPMLTTHLLDYLLTYHVNSRDHAMVTHVTDFIKAINNMVSGYFFVLFCCFVPIELKPKDFMC